MVDVLRFLADESCDFSVVRSLRNAAFNVVAVVEHSPGAIDEHVIGLAHRQKRILLTEDRDFGRLVFAAGHATNGVVYIRFPASRRAELPDRILLLVRREGERLARSFTVVGPNRTRVRILP